VAGRLSGKRAVVTGAAQGIGAAIARAFVGEGARIVIADVRAAAVQALVAELRRNGADAHPVVADIASPADVERLFATALDQLGGLDVLVNNAGVGGVGRSILETDLDEWERMLRVNLTGCFLCCRAAVPMLRAAGRGSIINLSSITGMTGAAGSVPYGAAKAGVLGLTKSLAREAAQWRINVNAIAPGLIDTEMSRARGQEASRAAVLWPRIGQPEDVAALAVFLASDEAEFITGQVVSPNGGAVI
jgi:3-oxoacyl-[acyl-carrier protein] reductase